MKPSLVLKFVLGFLALGLAAVGLFLPIWPTTPFVLVALGCFSAMPRIRAKILKIKFFREYYESYTEGRGLRRRTVMFSLLFLWGTLLASALLVGNAAMAAVLGVVGVAVTVHICWMARKRKGGAVARIRPTAGASPPPTAAACRPAAAHRPSRWRER